MERMVRYDLTSNGWHPFILPVKPHPQILEREKGFKPPSPVWSTGILSFKLLPQKLLMERCRGFEPRKRAWKAPILPIKLAPHLLLFIKILKNIDNCIFVFNILVSFKSICKLL